jgi:transposase
LRKADRYTVHDFSLSLDAMLPPDHRARTVAAFVEGLVLTPFYAAIKAVEGHAGHPHLDPALGVTLWLFATLDGVGSARRLESLCHEHTAYRWIVGGVSVNYHSLADFRVQHTERLDDLLTDSVAVLIDQDFVPLDTLAQDGMRVRAAAGIDTFRRKPTLLELREQARAHVARLKVQPDEDPAAASRRQQAARARAARERLARLEQAVAVMPQLEASREAFKKGTADKARASTTDAEARIMKMANGGFNPAFNVQYNTDVASGIIVDVAAVTQGTDNGQMGQSLARLEERYDRRPQQQLVDSGFASREDLEAAAQKGVAVYMPVKDAEKKEAHGDNPYQPRPGDPPGVAAWRMRMGTEGAKALYRLRASTAELINAGCRNRGFYQVRVRGVAKVLACVLWQALAHNLVRALALRAARAQAAAAALTLQTQAPHAGGAACPAEGAR